MPIRSNRVLVVCFGTIFMEESKEIFNLFRFRKVSFVFHYMPGNVSGHGTDLIVDKVRTENCGFYCRLWWQPTDLAVVMPQM